LRRGYISSESPLLAVIKKFRLLLRIEFTFKMSPAFQRVIKRPHRVYPHKQIDNVLNCLTQPELPRGPISQVSRDTGIPCQTLRDWHKQQIQETGENWFPLAQGHSQTDARYHSLNQQLQAAWHDLTTSQESG
jgi:hypothetical protein